MSEFKSVLEVLLNPLVALGLVGNLRKVASSVRVSAVFDLRRPPG